MRQCLRQWIEYFYRFQFLNKKSCWFNFFEKETLNSSKSMKLLIRYSTRGVEKQAKKGWINASRNSGGSAPEIDNVVRGSRQRLFGLRQRTELSRAQRAVPTSRPRRLVRSPTSRLPCALSFYSIFSFPTIRFLFNTILSL